jgi:hypothetical protein
MLLVTMRTAGRERSGTEKTVDVAHLASSPVIELRKRVKQRQFTLHVRLPMGISVPMATQPRDVSPTHPTHESPGAFSFAS